MSKISKMLSVTVVAAMVFSSLIFAGCSCKVKSKNSGQNSQQENTTTQEEIDSMNVVVLDNFVRIFEGLGNCDPDCPEGEQDDYAAFCNSAVVDIVTGQDSISLGVLKYYKRLGDTWIIYKKDANSDVSITWGYIKFEYTNKKYVCNILRTFGDKNGVYDILYRYEFNFDYDKMQGLDVIGFSAASEGSDYYRKKFKYDSKVSGDNRWVTSAISNDEQVSLKTYMTNFKKATISGNITIV